FAHTSILARVSLVALPFTSAFLSFLFIFSFFFLILRPPPRSTLFPYTTLFRSLLIPIKLRTRSGFFCLLFVDTIFLACAYSVRRSEEHTSELQSRFDLVCRLLLEKKKKKKIIIYDSNSKLVTRLPRRSRHLLLS